MSSARVTATLVDTAALGTAAGAAYRQGSFDHVPGSVLRGALAAEWLRGGGSSADAAFRAAFEGDGSFGPLHSRDSTPIPCSVWLHKQPPRALCNRWWWDEVDGDVRRECPDCTSMLVRSTGQPVGRPELVARTRVALDRDGVAIKGKLFRRAALAQGTELTGWVTGPAVAALTPDGRPVRRLRFGGERSIRGAATIEIELAAKARQPIERIDSTIVLRLVSPGVFVDRFGHPTDRPSPAELKRLLGIRKATVTRSWTRWTEVGGWHLASGLPKPRDRAVAAGSTYLIQCSEPPTDERLAVLGGRGIGLRRREGCGALGGRPAQPVCGSALLAAVTPAAGWAGWPGHAAQLRGIRGWPLRQDDPVRRQALFDRSLTPEQRTALQRLYAVADAQLAHSVIEELTSR